MRTGESERPITFAGARLGRYRHVCALFNTRDEEYRIFLPFIKEGLSHGEEAYHIVDPKLCRDHVERRATAGVNVASDGSPRTGRPPPEGVRVDFYESGWPMAVSLRT